MILTIHNKAILLPCKKYYIYLHSPSFWEMMEWNDFAGQGILFLVDAMDGNDTMNFSFLSWSSNHVCWSNSFFCQILSGHLSIHPSIKTAINPPLTYSVPWLKLFTLHDCVYYFCLFVLMLCSNESSLVTSCVTLLFIWALQCVCEVGMITDIKNTGPWLLSSSTSNSLWHSMDCANIQWLVSKHSAFHKNCACCELSWSLLYFNVVYFLNLYTIFFGFVWYCFILQQIL